MTQRKLMTLSLLKAQLLMELLEQHLIKAKAERQEKITFQLIKDVHDQLTLQKNINEHETTYLLSYQQTQIDYQPMQQIVLEEEVVPYYLKESIPPFPANDMMNDLFWTWFQNDAVPVKQEVTEHIHYLLTENGELLNLMLAYTPEQEVIHFTENSSLSDTKTVMIELQTTANQLPLWLTNWLQNNR